MGNRRGVDEDNDTLDLRVDEDDSIATIDDRALAGVSGGYRWQQVGNTPIAVDRRPPWAVETSVPTWERTQPMRPRGR